MSRRAVGLAAAAALLLAACGNDPARPGTGPATTGTSTGTTVEGQVVVLAAASLTDAFTELGGAFERENPGATATFSFGGSSQLAQQAVLGAPADVFAAASPATMRTVVEGGAVAGEPRVFATNVLQVAVPAGNPAGVAGLDDLAREELTVALCAEQVPCGAAALAAFEAAGLTAAPDTLEQDVRAVLAKVRLGEVDAGLVYRTDVLSAGEAVEGLDVPRAGEAANDYPVAVLTTAPNPGGAAAFVDLVLGPRGQEVLQRHGFTAP